MEERKKPSKNKTLIIADTLLDIMTGFFLGVGVATLDIKYMCVATFPVMGIGILHRVLKLTYYNQRSNRYSYKNDKCDLKNRKGREKHNGKDW